MKLKEISSFVFETAGVFLIVTSFAQAYSIKHTSMYPTLKESEKVFVEKLSYGAKITNTPIKLPVLRDIKEGDIVVFNHNGKDLVKRVAGYSKDGVYVLGDNAIVSYDSRHFGLINREEIKGRVVFRYWPVNRIGVVK